MTPERLNEIIAGGETLAVEFKSEANAALSDRELVDTVVCMANRPGEGEPGWLLVGVEDDGRVTGARPRHRAGFTDPMRVQALIANRTRPSVACRVEVVELDGAPVLVIEVPSSRMPVGTTDGVYVRRAIGGDGRPECLPFHFHEMQAMLADKGMFDYSAFAVPDACYEDLDSLEFERFRRAVRESEGRGDVSVLNLPDSELARALGAVEADRDATRVRVLGLLLFGKEEALRRFIPTHEVAFQVLSRDRVEVNDFFHWPLLRVMEEILSRFSARNREEELMAGLIRIGVPDYSTRAFREGVANALIHRDYSRLGAVHVQLHNDRIEIYNPGGFPEGVRLDNLLVTGPKPRNPLLADAFKRAGIVERTARGIDTIFYEQLRNGRRPPSYERSTETDVALILPGGEADLEFVRLLVEENRAGNPLALGDLLVLHRLSQEGRIAVDEAARLTQKPEAEARSMLQRLMETGLVEAPGAQKGRTFHLSASACQRLGQESAHVRQRGFDSLQQEQRILRYTAKHGRITRREASALCNVTGPQATRLLAKLVRKQKIVRHGQRKGTYYEPFSQI